jgi:hypothetical protein
MTTTINSTPGDWPAEVWQQWEAHVAPRFQEGETCTTANWFTARQYRNAYDRGSDCEGFVYVVQPGNRVCWCELLHRAHRLKARPAGR